MSLLHSFCHRDQYDKNLASALKSLSDGKSYAVLGEVRHSNLACYWFLHAFNVHGQATLTFLLFNRKIHLIFLLQASIEILFIFGSQVYPRGSYVITHARPWSVRPSLNISETALRIFLIFCMKLVTTVQKWQSPILKKNLGGSQMG